MGDMYRYEGLEASLYDQLDELSDFEDLSFYQWFAEAGEGPILDLGCGTGRILVPLVEGGFEVIGLDASSLMLEQCEKRLKDSGLEARLTQGDMCRFDLGAKRFGTIMVPGFSIQLLLGDRDMLDCLQCCRKHLRDNGQLIVPTHLPWEMIWDGRESSPMEERKEALDRQSGERLVAFQGWRLDRNAQLLHLENRIERRERSGKLVEAEEKSMTLRWYLPHEMLRLLEDAGFSDISVYGDFGFEAPEEDSESVIYVARA